MHVKLIGKLSLISFSVTFFYLHGSNPDDNGGGNVGESDIVGYAIAGRAWRQLHLRPRRCSRNVVVQLCSCDIIAASGNILNCNYMQIGSALFVMSPIYQ
ncbi:hypothetical protein AVEN_243420-1 [Araneus ventricosus]|uniref:Uncharacterized protein n=1 Tax=Araneus ventricosus TaxID=182803 RepID=A0A4Y2NYQ3_ARAVE|nr:hypothetical protein AVEN_243420-1 [Araneus ventricosus]